jgi:N-acetylmuramoyl-L-alanine amidase
MIKKITALFVLAGIACFFSSFDEHSPKQKRSYLKTIIIDPGHGGFDPGTHGLFSKEKDVALEISLKLGKAIEQAFPDMKIVYTRTTDIMPGNMSTIGAGLHYRAEVANKSHGDLFICIHGNSDGHSAGSYSVKRVIGHKYRMEYIGRGKRRKKIRVKSPIYDYYTAKNTRVGTGTYIWKADRNVFKGDAINQVAEGELEENMGDSTVTAFDMTSPEAKMRAQLYEKRYFANSAMFATLVEDEFAKTGRHSDGVMQRDKGIQVLQATGMPSVLIETGFLTNKEEEEYLNSEKGQDEIVQNIVDALTRYKDQLEGKNTTGVGGTSFRR